MEPPAKKSRKLLDDDSSSDTGDESGGVPINNQSNGFNFKINEDYARRFEHNKKREEIQKLEAKVGKDSKRRGDGSGSEEESSSEEEDEDGELATTALDEEIMATLKAIRSKDPRVYDKDVQFYAEEDAATKPEDAEKEKKPKSMTLRDYHRENLLSGNPLPEDDTSDAPRTYAQEQEDLKKSIVQQMHAAADGEDRPSDNDDEENEDFLVRKSAPEPASASKKDAKLDIENADKDPENFLSNFLSARAWIPADRVNMQPFESDDEEEDARAEAFEEAYNFRFEDPSKINTQLITHSRDTTNQQSVRREDKSGRKKIRDAERQRKEEEKKQRETEKNRLRKLKTEELQEKVNKVKEVAGLRASQFTDEDWAKFLDGAWDDKDWEKEMQKNFGEEYYAEGDDLGGDGEGKKKHPKKPTWDDDIDITDLVPDFDDEGKPALDASDAEMEDADDADEGSSKNKKSKAQEKRDQKREARKDKLRIDEAVDRNLDLDVALLPGASKKNTGPFRYRETSPQSFGLTARDILMADDTHLNQFAGLKKLASFRDEEKKSKDQRKLGKKARLRQWRKDTFGTEDGPEFSFGGDKIPEKDDAAEADNVDIREGEPRKKKRKRSKKN
ncbi:Krr1-domain-containing protein [Aspergillus steynii IBT 23096]|uniref:Krr1-domain-containing protein n=1 Tax=Aspergillus steynii IBT 23096 TaxID=1392250 RepID=A0A2I2G1M5_9EURO|nr:Krr1-domain-containing protein [Aspergillus steynii IBT 23096]PLB46766.1 Krr1-domain-containing protein [Aspergillus steynii IBT 23096]